MIRTDLNITPQGGGGTSFSVIFEYLQNELAADPPAAILIFTDGYASSPGETEALGIPVLWLISRDGRTDLPWGTVVKIE